MGEPTADFEFFQVRNAGQKPWLELIVPMNYGRPPFYRATDAATGEMWDVELSDDGDVDYLEQLARLQRPAKGPGVK